MTLLLPRPLGIRRVSLLWGGLSLSALGDQLYAVALVWVAVRVLARAWVRVLWRAWQNATAYDPTKHTAANNISA